MCYSRTGLWRMPTLPPGLESIFSRPNLSAYWAYSSNRGQGVKVRQRTLPGGTSRQKMSKLLSSPLKRAANSPCSSVVICLHTTSYRYWDSNDGGRPGSNSQSSTYIQNFNFENIHGTLGPFKSVYSLRSSNYPYVQWNPLTGNGKGVTDSIILTLFKGSAADITFKDINIQPNKPEYGSTTVQCNPDVFTKADLADLGIQCVTGQYKATK